MMARMYGFNRGIIIMQDKVRCSSGIKLLKGSKSVLTNIKTWVPVPKVYNAFVLIWTTEFAVSTSAKDSSTKVAFLINRNSVIVLLVRALEISPPTDTNDIRTITLLGLTW